MNVEPVAEQFGASEISFPEYRVYFLERTGPRMPSGGTFHSAVFCYKLTEAHNVHQVFAWADANAYGRRYIIYAVIDHPDHRWMLQLCGDDSNRPDDPHRRAPADLDPTDASADLVSFMHRFGHTDFDLGPA